MRVGVCVCMCQCEGHVFTDVCVSTPRLNMFRSLDKSCDWLAVKQRER